MRSKLYIGNIPFTTTEDELSHHFSDAGEVVSARIIKDRQTGRSKGFGFLEMSSEDEAQDAISQMDGTDLGGREIRVSEARDKRKERPYNNDFFSRGSHRR